MMRSVLWTFVVILAFGLVIGCSSEEPKEDTAGAVDRTGTTGSGAGVEAIQESLNEVVARWHSGDKAVLYDNEFPYLRDDLTFEDYLENEQVQRLEADSLAAMKVKDVQFFGEDSAAVDIDVIFVGPLGDTSRLDNKYTMYYYGGRWLRPTLSEFVKQEEREVDRRIADSAAAAESDDEEW